MITLVACPVSKRAPGAPRLSGPIRLRLEPGSRLATIYASPIAEESFTCNYELNPRYAPALARGGFRFTAFSEQGEPRGGERQDHPFFVATLYQPQLSSTPDKPHPVFVEYLRAIEK